MRRMIQTPMAVSLLALMAACSPQQPSAGPAETTAAVQEVATEQTETARLNAWFAELFEEDLARSPETQTALGRVDDLDAYGRWDAVDEADAAAANARRIERLDHLRNNFDFEALDAKARVSYRVFEYLQQTGVRNYEFRDQRYIFTQMFGPHTGLPTTLISQHRITNTEQADAYIRRLEGMGPILGELIEQAETRAAAGVLPPRFAFAYLIDNTAQLVAGAPFDDSGTASPLLADFTAKVEALEIDDDAKADLIARATTALLGQVGPAYTDLLAMFERHREMTDERDGAWKLPRGLLPGPAGDLHHHARPLARGNSPDRARRDRPHSRRDGRDHGPGGL